MALGNCNGGTLFFPPSVSAYVFTTQIMVTARCTLVTDSLYPAHIQRGFSQSSTNAYVGLMQVTASGVSIQGLEIDGNNGTYTGNCITVAAQVTDIQIDNNYIHNCDGDSIDLVGTAQGNPGPSRVQITRNRIISGANGEGAIHARDTGDDILIAENPIIDGSQMITGDSSATIQLQSSGLTTALTNISIENNPKILCAADFCLQAGGFNGYTMTGLKVTGNGMELAQNSSGFISTATLGGVFSNNTFNTHFVDLYQTGSDGVTNGTTTFTSASANFTSSVTGRTLVCMGCGVSSGNLITTVTYVNATTVTLGTAATSSASGQTWQLFGYSHTFVAVELPETTGAVVTDNTCYCEGSLQGGFVEMDSSVGSNVSNNVVYGFGEDAGVGITAYGVVADQPIGSVTQIGNIVTVTVSTPPLGGIWQPGVTVAICSTTPSCASTSYFGLYTILNQNYSRSSGTFSYFVQNAVATPTTLCSALCGTVNGAIANNTISDNTIFLPVALPITSTVYCLQTRATTSVEYVYGNLFEGNKCIGTNGVAGESGFGASGGNTIVDSNVVQHNSFTNLTNGIDRGNGTNFKFLYNTFEAVPTPYTGTTQLGEILIDVPLQTQRIPTDVTGIVATTASGAVSSPQFTWGSTSAANTVFQENTDYAIHCSGTTTQATAGNGIGIAFQFGTAPKQL